MAYYTSEVIDTIGEHARVFYIDQRLTRAWNENRRGKELRLLTGWTWVQRGGEGKSRTGFKTRSAALRDAYYVLVQHREQPADVSTRRKPMLVVAA